MGGPPYSFGMSNAAKEIEVEVGKVYWSAYVYADNSVRIYANGDFMSAGSWDGARLTCTISPLSANPAIAQLEAELRKAA